MRKVRLITVVAMVAALTGPAEAGAARIPVLRLDGTVTARADPGVAARGPDARSTHLEHRAGVARAAPRRTVTAELGALYAAGALDLPTYLARRAEYVAFKAAVKRFSGRRRLDMDGVLDVIDGIAARAQLTPSRIAPLWLTMARNRQWWNEGPLLAPGQRVSFAGSEVVWQYVRGEGLQLHPLANFGKLNALWRARGGAVRLATLLDELLPLAAARAGGSAWEYYFDFGSGRPPWVSGLAQGTALQAVARAAVKLGRTADVLPLARLGLGIFRTPPPEGVHVDTDGGAHFLQYSYAPGLRVLNGFVQSLVGLHDYAELAGDAEAHALYEAGLVAARAEVPRYDTGAWSLYSLGTSVHESDLHYHALVRDFLMSLCDRAPEPVFCEAGARFDAYLAQPPAVALVTRRLRGGRSGALRFSLSKVARVRVRITRGPSLVLSRGALVGHGEQAEVFAVPRRPGVYDVSLTATDLAGNESAVAGTVRVLRPRR